MLSTFTLPISPINDKLQSQELRRLTNDRQTKQKFFMNDFINKTIHHTHGP